MKKLLILVLTISLTVSTRAQQEETQQLLLNVEKLAQFTKILKGMYDAYKILYKGYTAVKDISEGNFNLHKTFLDGLLQVSPAVRKYKRVADIISYQIRIVKETKATLSRFKSDATFSASELKYMSVVFDNVLSESLKNLDELLLVVTAGKLRMNDDERLNAIDRVFQSVEWQLSFVRDFSNSTSILSLQRKSEQAEISMSRRLNGF